MQLQGSRMTLLNSADCSKMETDLSQFGSLWCPWCGLAVEGSLLIPAGHCGVHQQSLKARLGACS